MCTWLLHPNWRSIKKKQLVALKQLKGNAASYNKYLISYCGMLQILKVYIRSKVIWRIQGINSTKGSLMQILNFVPRRSWPKTCWKHERVFGGSIAMYFLWFKTLLYMPAIGLYRRQDTGTEDPLMFTNCIISMSLLWRLKPGCIFILYVHSILLPKYYFM